MDNKKLITCINVMRDCYRRVATHEDELENRAFHNSYDAIYGSIMWPKTDVEPDTDVEPREGPFVCGRYAGFA